MIDFLITAAQLNPKTAMLVGLTWIFILGLYVDSLEDK